MSRKQHIKSFKMFDAESLSANIESEVTYVESSDQGTIFISWTGSSPAGTITVEASNSSNDDISKSSAIWHELDFGSAISVSGASGSHEINFIAMPFRAIKLKYTRSSGSGTINAILHTTTVGA